MDSETNAVRVENFAYSARRCAALNEQFGIFFTTASNMIHAYDDEESDDEMGGGGKFYFSFSKKLITC